MSELTPLEKNLLLQETFGPEAERFWKGKLPPWMKKAKEDATTLRQGVDFYTDWAQRLGKTSFPSLENSPIKETFGKNTSGVESALNRLYEYVNPNNEGIWESSIFKNEDFYKGKGKSELLNRIQQVDEELLKRQQFILEAANKSSPTIQNGAVFDFQSFAPAFEKQTGVKFMYGLNTQDNSPLLGAQHETGHVAMDLLGLNPDQRQLIYNNSRLPERLARRIRPGNWIKQTGPLLPYNEGAAQLYNLGLMIKDPSIEIIKKQFESGFFGDEANEFNNQMLATVKNTFADRGKSLKDSLDKQHLAFTSPYSDPRLYDVAKRLGLPELFQEKVIRPLNTRLENIANAQSLNVDPFFNARSLNPAVKKTYIDDAPGLRSHTLFDTISQLSRMREIVTSDSGEPKTKPGMFGYDNTGYLLYASDPIGTAVKGFGDLVRNNKGGAALGVISTLNNPSTVQAAQKGDFGKVGTDLGKAAVLGGVTDAVINAGMRALPANIQKLAMGANQFLGPAAAVTAGATLFSQGKDDSLLTAAANAAGRATRGLPITLSPDPNTDIGKKTGEVIKQTAGSFIDAAGSAYNHLDTLFGGALPGGVDPRFNGFNATRDLTAAQQLDYRRGGGDAARRQNPGLTPQQVIEQGRQAVAAATRAQQNNTTAPTGRPANTRPTPGQTGNLGGNRGSNIGRPANTRPSSSASGTPVSRPGSRVAPRRTGQNSTVIDIGKVVNYWGNRIFNWR